MLNETTLSFYSSQWEIYESSCQRCFFYNSCNRRATLINYYSNSVCLLANSIGFWVTRRYSESIEKGAFIQPLSVGFIETETFSSQYGFISIRNHLLKWFCSSDVFLTIETKSKPDIKSVFGVKVSAKHWLKICTVRNSAQNEVRNISSDKSSHVFH